MSQVIYLDSRSNEEVYQQYSELFKISLKANNFTFVRELSKLIKFISVTGNNELDLDYPTVIIINENTPTLQTPIDELPNKFNRTNLNTLDYDTIELLFHHHYKHMNCLIYKLSEFSITQVNRDIEKYHQVLKNRIIRMKSWTGLNNQNTKDCPCLHSMTNCLNIILQYDNKETIKLRNLVLLINNEVDFQSLLKLPKSHVYYLYCIGNWGFIAHELTCDELTYCALLIFKLAFSILEESNPLKLSDNAVLSFLFSTRDSYHGGNAFHNFRHAVDVLQATFYFLIRIEALPKFEQYTPELNLHPNDQFELHQKLPLEFHDIDSSLLKPVQTLALLVASIGHDVGHPGLTNPFLINNKSPVSKIFSNQSVLENYHSTIFQDILVNHWPVFLDNEHTTNSADPLNTKALQVESIIATDMANHNEYISKVKQIGEVLQTPENRSKIKHCLRLTGIILSLIIKCADISNVARPLLISSKWGIVLAKEFKEISQLDAHLNKGEDIDSLIDPRAQPSFPTEIKEALKLNSQLPNGQIFFINTFADELFKGVAGVLPELQFSADIVQNNKEFWTRVQKGDIELD